MSMHRSMVYQSAGQAMDISKNYKRKTKGSSHTGEKHESVMTSTFDGPNSTITMQKRRISSVHAKNKSNRHRTAVGKFQPLQKEKEHCTCRCDNPCILFSVVISTINFLYTISYVRKH